MPSPFPFFTYRITPDVPPSYYEKLCDFIYTQYLIPQNHQFIGITRESTIKGEKLTYTITDQQGSLLYVEIKSGTPFELRITPLKASVPKTTVEEAKQDILIAMQVFSQNARSGAVCFAWREGEKIVPEAYTKPEKSFNRLFLETQVLFFVVFIVFGMFIFITIATVVPSAFWIAPLILIAIQFIFVFYSNKFITRNAEWHITEANPTIHILEYYLPVNEMGDFKKIYPRETLLAIKKEIYAEIIAKQGEVDAEIAQKIFLKHGVPCEVQNLKTKKINVYNLVKNIADRFHFPMPKVVVSNTLVPNAAASGPSPKRGLVLITTGILAQLNNDELLGVLGHEFGHLRGRDPLILYGLVSTEFLFRFYVLFPLFPIIFSSLLFFVYFWAIMVLIFFIAKFFEARADLISAMVVGNPHVLAESLEKIGFQRLLYERAPSYRIQEWLGLDPHPPIYFRVNRLESLQPGTIRYPLIQSIKDVTRGFIATLKN
ncbi:MAG: M48 family metalloprotease [Nitrososphaerota archaeon]|nr:M48 family metalloprotease [Nitrososphaerota archaeon]